MLNCNPPSLEKHNISHIIFTDSINSTTNIKIIRENHLLSNVDLLLTFEGNRYHIKRF